MNILKYKRSSKVCFDNLEYGDVFIFDDRVYMKVSNVMISQNKKEFITLYYNCNNSYDFGVNLETGEPREIAGGTWVEPLGEINIKKDDK